VSLNDHALQTIEASRNPPLITRVQVLFSLLNSNLTEEAAVGTFLLSMDSISDQIRRLREEAEISRDYLTRLKRHLNILHEIISREDKKLSKAHDEVLAELWTWLGGNKRELREMNLNLNLLKNVGKYRKKALMHVIVTLDTLDTLDADMEELRTKVAAPNLVGDKIPIEVQIKSIKAGVDRLREGQMRASSRRGERLKKMQENEA